MMLILRDDAVIEIFDSPTNPPNWIEGTDIENEEYRFCDDSGQQFIGVITKPSSLIHQAKFALQRSGPPNPANAIALVDQAKALEANDRFQSLVELRQHLATKSE